MPTVPYTSNQDIFIQKKKEQVAGMPIGVIMGKGPTKGFVGIEVEVEGNKFPKPYDYGPKPRTMEGWKFWSACKDGSLRGADNAEYVLTKPIEFSEVPAAIKELKSNLTAYGSVLADSNRTSVHIHLNFQERYMNELASFCALYFCFEEVLTEWCGDHRVGNLFCLRGKDAPAIVSKIRRYIQYDGSYELSEGLHYAGLNVHALTKFGSVEVRSFRGPTDLDAITPWVSILERLYNRAISYQDPRDIPALFSQKGPIAFFEDILGGEGSQIRQTLGWTDSQIADSMYEGIRMAQDISYCRDWGVYKPVKVVPDPFGRKPRKTMSAPLTEMISAYSIPTPVFNPTLMSAPQWDPPEPEPYQPEDSDED